ncbi:Uncharacterised protein [BD1-7 clade bacterium]|uniref:Uncharacterized protein n=1 Tax=BD1-7 clade bacterium TaxID=2029982 RepID=A0A5S9P650_9GAMM|nr:Uncharacterised protein [BD1-7 clade bacterium]
MSEAIFSAYKERLAVEEPKPAEEKSLQSLSKTEHQLFQILLKNQTVLASIIGI